MSSSTALVISVLSDQTTVRSHYRVSVVGIRSNGGHPCPRCLVSSCDIHDLGSAGDRSIRSMQYRTDDESLRKKVKKARGLIYGKRHYSVNSDPVKAELKPTSLVPAQVSQLPL